MNLITTGVLTLGPARAAFSPPPPAGHGALILRVLGQQYHVPDPAPSLIFRSATGQTLAALVTRDASRPRGAALLQAGVDALRACWLIDHSAGGPRVEVRVQALRAGGAWYDLAGEPLGDADLAFLPTLHAASALRAHYPLLPEDRPTGWYGLPLALARARYRPPFPRHPRVILAVEGREMTPGEVQMVPALKLVPSVVRLSHPDEPLWEVLYAADMPLPEEHVSPGAAALRTVALLTARPGLAELEASWTLHWQAVQAVDASGASQGPLHVYHVDAEPDDLPPASEFDRAWVAWALAEQSWACMHRNAVDWPVACVPIFTPAEQQVGA